MNRDSRVEPSSGPTFETAADGGLLWRVDANCRGGFVAAPITIRFPSAVREHSAKELKRPANEPGSEATGPLGTIRVP
jgi:hypothetical protein